MPHLFKVAEIDLSFFTGDSTWLTLKAKESEHGYDYDVGYYSDTIDPIKVIEKHWVFYDQPSAGTAADFMAAKIKEILS